MKETVGSNSFVQQLFVDWLICSLSVRRAWSSFVRHGKRSVSEPISYQHYIDDVFQRQFELLSRDTGELSDDDGEVPDDSDDEETPKPQPGQLTEFGQDLERYY